jgi:hypothetical protein
MKGLGRGWLLTAGIGAVSVAGYFSYVAYRERSVAKAFAPTIALVNNRSFAPDVAVQRNRAQPTSLVVLIRDVNTITAETGSGYVVRQGQSWNVPLAHTSRDATVALLVDKIALTVRSYRPAGDDHQIILHCILVDLSTLRSFSSFTVRGSLPARRDGLLSIFGQVPSHGSEPWPQVRARVKTELARL